MRNNKGKTTVNWKRWLKAQKYERNFWQKLAIKIESGAISQLDWYRWKATELEKRLLKFMDVETIEEAKVLEIGSGPIGVVSFLKWGERYAIDPLEDFYRASSTLTRLRNHGVTYLKGTGEDLPFNSSFFSLVIIDNVIDHTYAPDTILQEIHRVLDKNGLLYLAVNVRTRWGATVHKLLASLYIDRGHPYTFTREAIRELLVGHQFNICGEEIEDYHQIKEKNCQSKSLKDKLKGYSGISEFQTILFVKNFNN